jgi:hypothetical protein
MDKQKNKALIQIHVSSDFKAKVKIQAALKNMTIKQYIINLVEEDTEKENQGE